MKITFLAAFEHWEKEAHSLLAAQCVDITVVSECLGILVLSIQYNPQLFVVVNRFYILTIQCQ